MEQPVLEVRGLSVSLRTERGIVHATDGVSFNVKKGETLAVVGESGSGKSVTVRSIPGLLSSGVVHKREGTVRFLGDDLLAMSERELSSIRGRDIGMIFQDPMTSLNPVVRIGVQVSEPLRRHLGLSKAESRERAVKLLEEVHIPDAADRVDSLPHEFSGGMRQRALIAAATACRPSLLIADEPTTALDVTVEAEILGLLRDLQRKHGMALILVSHDLKVVSRVADTVAVMYAGQVVELAPAAELFARPEHPYTEGLLASIPPLTPDHSKIRNERLTAIGGTSPDLREPPAVCRFSERCQYAYLRDECLSSIPDLSEVRPNHWVRTAHPRSIRVQDGPPRSPTSLRPNAGSR